MALRRRMSSFSEDVFGSTTSLTSLKDGLKQLQKKTKITHRKSRVKLDLIASLLDALGVGMKGSQKNACPMFAEIANVLIECDPEICTADWQLIFCTIFGYYSALKDVEVRTRLTQFWSIVASDMRRAYGSDQNGYQISLQQYIKPLIQTYKDIGERASYKWSNIVKQMNYVLEDIIEQFNTINWNTNESLDKQSVTLVLTLIIEAYNRDCPHQTRQGLLLLLSSYIGIEKYETLLHFATRSNLQNLVLILLQNETHQTSVNEKDAAGHTPIYYVTSAKLLLKMLDHPFISFPVVVNDMENVVLDSLDQAKSHIDNWNNIDICKTILCHPKLNIMGGKHGGKIVHMMLQICLQFKASGNRLATELKTLLVSILGSLSKNEMLNSLDQDKLFEEVRASRQYGFFTLLQNANILTKTTSEMLNAPGNDGRHILYTLSEQIKDNLDAILSILKLDNININPEVTHEEPLFIHCLLKGSEHIVKNLMKHSNFDIIHCSGDHLYKVVHYIVKGNMSKELLETVLEQHDCGVDEEDTEGFTPLYHALKNKSWDIAKVLCSHEKVSINKSSIPHLLIDQQPSRQMLQYLKQYHPNKKLDLCLQNSKGNTVLHRAAKKASMSLLQDIFAMNLSGAVDLNVQNNEYETPLHWSINMLYYIGTKDWIQTSTKTYTKLQQKEVVLFLLRQPGIDVNIKDAKGNGIMHTALMSQVNMKGAKSNDKVKLTPKSPEIDVDVVLQILKVESIDINLQDTDDNTIIHTVLLRKDIGDREIILRKLLAKESIDLSLRNVNGDTALHLTARSNLSEEITDNILHKSINFVNAKNSPRDKCSESALEIAISNKRLSFASRLLQMEETDPNGFIGDEFILFNCFINRYKDLVDLILAHKRLDISASDKDGDTCLHRIITDKTLYNLPYDPTETKSPTTLQKVLCHNDIDIYKEDKTGYSSFYHAIRQKDSSAIQLFLDHASCNVSYIDSHGQPIVFYAIESLTPRCVRLFIEHKSFDPNVKNEFHQNAKDIIELLPREKKTSQIKSLIDHATECSQSPLDLLHEKVGEISNIITKCTTATVTEKQKTELRSIMDFFHHTVLSIQRDDNKESAEMKIQDFDVLLRHRVYLLEELEMGHILDHLIQDGIITQDQYEEIDVERTRKDKAKKLLDMLPRCGPEAFSSFIKALKEHQPHVAQKLLERHCISEVDNNDDVFTS